MMHSARNVWIRDPLASGLSGTHRSQRSFAPRQILALARAQRGLMLRRQVRDGVDAVTNPVTLAFTQASPGLHVRIGGNY